MNLDLIRRVAEALGWPVLFDKWPEKTGQYPCLMFVRGVAFKLTDYVVHKEWNPTTDYHQALDALMAFCDRNNCQWETREVSKGRYNCTIWNYEPELDLAADEFDNSLAICICKAIVEAAQKTKKEAGAGEGK